MTRSSSKTKLRSSSTQLAEEFSKDFSEEIRRLLVPQIETAMNEIHKTLKDELSAMMSDLFKGLFEDVDGFAGDWLGLFSERLAGGISSSITGSFTDFLGEGILGNIFNSTVESQPITVVNVVDPSFVDAAIEKNPKTVINVINDDIIRNGSTRKTIKSLT